MSRPTFLGGGEQFTLLDGKTKAVSYPMLG